MEECIKIYSNSGSRSSGNLADEQECQDSSPYFHFTSSISTIAKDGNTQKIDSKYSDNAASFSKNMEYWGQETALLSTGNFNNSYFKEIVNMGKDAVPFIMAELEKGPTPLVHALDLIFPGVVKYDGFISLEEACQKWLSILQQIA